MPYIPLNNRKVIDEAVEILAKEIAGKSTSLSLVSLYKSTFSKIAYSLRLLIAGNDIFILSAEASLAKAIYKNDTVYLGELNYAITRLIQRVPQLKVQNCTWTQELRYWIYVSTVEALIHTSREIACFSMGIGGVFEDIKDEYKRRVNVPYEAWQIIKNGDCFDTPYYTRLIEVVDENGRLVGYQEIMLRRSDKTLNCSVLDFQIVVKKNT